MKGEGATTVALDPTLDEELLAEGIARELVNRIQRLRKDGGLDITDRINVGIAGPADVLGAAHVHRDFISRETLALDVAMVDALDGDGFAHVLEIDIDGSAAWIGLSVVTA